MIAEPDDLPVNEILKLRSGQMLLVNPEYQRGAVWTTSQQKRLIDSVLRGYPLPLIYLHLIKQAAGKLVNQRYEVIDGQQRINALADYAEGAFKLFDPIADEAEARFPEFVRRQACPWGGKRFKELDAALQARFLNTPLRIVQITTDEPHEARDLFVRLQAGMPLNSQEKRDAWPGQFTDFVLQLGGKSGIARYPGHEFFNILMGAKGSSDRGKFRQLAAQISALFLSRLADPARPLRDTNAASLDSFYYENLDFDEESERPARLRMVLDKAYQLLRDGKRKKIIGHEAIHIVLLLDSLLDDYTRAWEDRFAEAFDQFRVNFAKAKATKDGSAPSDYWIRYGVLTRVNSDRGEEIRRRHEFFVARMMEVLRPTLKDPQRLFGAVEKELIYYRDKKTCTVCGGSVVWTDAQFHHVDMHSRGGGSVIDNGALAHGKCHPKSDSSVAAFAAKWPQYLASIG